MSEEEQEKSSLGYQTPVVPPASKTRRWACLLAFVLGVANLILGLGYGVLLVAEQLGIHLMVGSGEIYLHHNIPGPLLVVTVVALLFGVLYLLGAVRIQQGNKRWALGLFLAGTADYLLVASDILVARNSINLEYVTLFALQFLLPRPAFLLLYREALEQRRAKRDKMRAT